jgi:hypothetical protein
MMDCCRREKERVEMVVVVVVVVIRISRKEIRE